MKRLTLILPLLICMQTFAGEQLFLQANTEYTNENYETAISLYDSILTKEIASSELYYNLGNCHYKTQDWANSIWHYEKSLQLEKNEKTIHNLNLAKLKIIDRIEPLPQLFYKKWGLTIQGFISTKHWQYLAILSIFLALLFKTLHTFYNKNTKKYFLLSLFTAFVLFFISLSSHQNSWIKKEGIIFDSTVVITSAPTSNSTELFTLHAGAKVEITDTIGNWIYIRIANGNSGWLSQNSVKEL